MPTSLQLCQQPFSYDWIRVAFDANSPELQSLSPYQKQTLIFCQQWLNGDQTFTLYTSGSTGSPKPIIITRQQMQISAANTGRALGLKKGDCALVCLNTAYIAGVMMLVRGFELDLQMTIIEPTREPLAEATSVDFVALVPMQVETILNTPAQRAQFNQIKAVLIGGAPIHPQLEGDLQAVEAACYHTYGMTETVTHIALRRLNGSAAADHFTAFADVSLGLDQRGCLTICAPVTGQKTITTNDRAELLGDGAFRWLGRIDNVINSGGVKVQAEKVENILKRMVPQRRLFVVGLPDPTLGERVTAFVEGEPLGLKLREQLGTAPELSRYQRPKAIHFLPTFQETPTGKIDRNATVALLEKTHHAS